MIELKEHFIGREFVFRTDWTNQLVVYGGTPTHLCFTTPHQREKCLENSKKHARLLAPSGMTGRITDVSQQSTWRLFLAFESDDGHTGHLIVETLHLDNWAMHGPMAHDQWTDETTAPSDIENLLTQSTIRFLDPDISDVQAVAEEIPSPPAALTLTPADNTTPVQADVQQSVAVRNVTVAAKPENVLPGKVIDLVIRYEVAAGMNETAEVTETRTLLFSDKTLPGYPKVRKSLQHTGIQSSTFSQKIPSRAKHGTYTYKGEVCVDDGCSSQTVRFTINAR
ncbi:MAG: hypothetical protein ABW076_00720 [Candidatus Thiodiazotropha sp.]